MVDIHNNSRFLNKYNDKKLFRHAIIFNPFYEGISMFYYGDEQYFNGGNDSNNRENMIGYCYTNTDIYNMLKIANEIRKKENTYEEF